MSAPTNFRLMLLEPSSRDIDNLYDNRKYDNLYEIKYEKQYEKEYESKRFLQQVWMRVCMQANTRAIVSKYERNSQYDSKYVSLHES